ncbi:Uncharacterised protein [Streptococcus pneumoniae]|nr:Uncharacterised protein [Streptococcus pneumoniae]
MLGKIDTLLSVLTKIVLPAIIHLLNHLIHALFYLPLAKVSSHFPLGQGDVQAAFVYLEMARDVKQEHLLIQFVLLNQVP